MMTLGMLWHLGPPLAQGRLMKISPFTFQTEFGLAPDHSAGAPLTVLQREHAPPKKISTRPEPLPWRSLREHMVTWLWDARGLDVLRLLFPVKRFKPLGYDRSLWCLLSIELGNKEEGERGREVGWGTVVMVAVMWGRGLLLEGNHLCGVTPEEGGDAQNLCFNAATPTKGR